jgi:hypothetical protein
MIGATDVAEPNSDKVEIYLHHTQHCSRRTGIPQDVRALNTSMSETTAKNGRTQVVH